MSADLRNGGRRRGKKRLAGIAALALVLGIAFAAPFGASQLQPNDAAPADVAQQQDSVAGGSGAAGDEPAPDDDATGAAERGSGTALAASAPASSTLTATFLDVGQGDCCIIRCGGKTMIVDGGPPNASSRVYSWLKNQRIKTIDYLVATHSDTDHVGGLSAALEACACKRAYCSVSSASQDAFNDMKKRLARQGVKLKVPKVGSSWKLGSARVKVIAGGGAGNEGSLVLQVTHGAVRMLLAGDSTSAAEAGYSARLSSVDLLKVAHHGSADSSSYRFLRACMPKNAVISAGRGNSYGHPTEATLSRLRDCGAKVYRTDMQGDITATSTVKKLSVKVAHNANANTFLELSGSSSSSSASPGSGSSASTSSYIGNANSLKFHRPSCTTLPLEHNRIYFKTRSAAVSAGYTPCGNCKP